MKTIYRLIGIILLSLLFLSQSIVNKKDKIELIIQNGHSNSVTSVAFSPDGKFFISGSQDKTIKLWSISGKLLHTFEGHSSYVNSVAISPDGNRIISGSSDNAIKLWEISGKLLHTFEGHSSYVNSVAISPDGNRIISGSSDNTIKLWDLTGKLLHTFEGHSASVNSVAISPDGNRIISGSRDKAIKLWDISGKLLHTFEGHSSSVEGAVISPDGRTIISFSEDKMIKFWDVSSKMVRTFERNSYGITSVAISPDGDKIIYASWDHTIKLLNISGKLLSTFKGHSSKVTSIAISPDGNKIISGSWDNTIEFRDIAGKLLHTFEGLSNWVNSVAISPDGDKIISGFSGDNTIKLLNISGKLLSTFKGHSDSVTSVAISSDGNKIISGSLDKTMKLWDISGQLLHTFEGHSSSVESVAISRDGNKIISGSTDETIKLWDISGKLLNTFEGHSWYVSGIAISPDGNKIISGSWDSTIKLWDISGKLLNTFERYSCKVGSIAISPDGDKIISGSTDKTIKLLSISGKLLHIFEGHSSSIESVAISPDGDKIISGSSDRTIKLWDISGKLLHTFEGHSLEVNSVVFSSDGKFIVSGSYDTTIKIWNVKKKMLIVTFIAFKDGEGILYTPDNYYMVTDQSALRAVSFKKENKIYDFDQFDLKFNRPDIIMDRMRGLFLQKEKDEKDETFNDRVKDYENKIALYKNYYEHRIKQNGFKLEQLSGENKIHAPEVTEVKVNNQGVESKEFDTKTKKQKVKLSFAIEDEKDSNLDIVGYKVFVQGVPLHGQYMKKFPTPAKRKTVEEEITLSTLTDIGDSAGTNTVEIMGYTSDGIESSKYKLYLHYESPNPNKKGKLYLVTLGTETYRKGNKSDLKDLTYTIKDADDLQKLFKEKNDKEKTYDDIIQIFYTNEAINRNQVNKIRETLNQSEVDDTVIFFVSGHGMRADTPDFTAKSIASELGISQSLGETSNKNGTQNVYYYMTSTSSSKEPWKNGIPMESFRYALDGIKARQKILLIDTCQSGEVVPLTGYKPSQQRIDEIVKLRQNFKNQVAEKGIVRIKGDGEEETLDGEAKFYRNFAFEWELRELSKMFPELRRGTGTIEISATSGTQSALESSKWKNGAFTFTIKEAILEGKAKDGANVTAKSLRKYILDRVERLTEGKQIPMVTRDISGRDFLITK